MEPKIINIQVQPSITLNLPDISVPTLEDRYNKYSNNSYKETLSNLEHAIEQTKTLLEDLLPFLPYDVYEKVVIEQRERSKSNIETKEWTVKFYLNDGIGDLKQTTFLQKNLKNYYEDSYMRKNYDEIYSVIEKINSIDNIIMEHWDEKSYISFNIFSKEYKQNILSIAMLKETFELSLDIGDEYYIFSSHTQPETFEKFKLKEIKKDKGRQDLLFESKSGKVKTLSSQTAKGYVSTRKQNINRLQSHTIISKIKSSFIEQVMLLLEEELSFTLELKELPAYFAKISELIEKEE